MSNHFATDRKRIVNICFLTSDMSWHGGTTHMASFLANALNNNHRVSVVGLHQEKEDLFFKLDKQVSYYVLSKNSKHNSKLAIIQQIRLIHLFIKKNNIDCLINVDVGMGFYGILAAKGTKAKVITWEHGNYFNNWGSNLFPYLRRYAARKSDALVVLTQKDVNNYMTNIKHCAPIFVISNPCQKRFHCYDLNSKIILSVGHLNENKGYHHISTIAKQVFARHPDWKWIICGEGPERARLESLFKESKVDSHVILAGLVNNMDQYYSSAAISVLTSKMEGLPMVLLEAKSHGLPIVSFDIQTGPSDIVRDGVNGYLIEAENASGMADKICKLIENPDLRKEFSEHSKYDMDKFDEESIVKQWEKLIANI